VQAFEELYRAHVGRVYAVCLRICGRPAVAEELTQEAFVRAWQRLGSFRGESAFSTWLHPVAVNVALSAQRRRRTRDRWEKEEEPPPDKARVPPPDSERRLDLESALHELPEGARTVFVLHDVEGYKHVEIAEMTGIAPGTSKAQLHRARQLLRGMLRVP
jgi:RNA polymerase sigma-70 factor (ECF subfamily)